MSHGVANFSGDLANQIACVGLLGQQGCRFSGPFKSIREALSPAGAGQATQVNLGFLRPDALLAVVLLSNKDDCSTPRDSPLGDPTQTRMSDSLGPFDRFRCNELGHLCQINGALTHPPRGAAADLPGCVSNESSNDMLTKVADEVAFLQSLKTNPALLTVAAITGPVTPYSIDMVQEAGAPEAHPRVHPSCQSTAGDYGEPAVRIQQWANALGGMKFPICADSLAPALQTIGQGIVDRAGAMCFTKPFPPRTDSAQPNCRVADLSNMAGMSIGRVGQSIPNCVDNGGAAPCWTAVLDPAHCGGGTKWLVITRTTPAPPGSFVGISCHSCSLDGLEVGC
jgi:hypothetical protein